MPCVSTNPGKSTSIAPISYSLLSYSWQVPEQGQRLIPTQHPLFAGAPSTQWRLRKEHCPGCKPSTTLLPCGVKTETLGIIIHLTSRRRVAVGLQCPLGSVAGASSLSIATDVGFCCPKRRKFPVTLTLIFIFAPSLACSVIVNDEGTAMFCLHIKSHLFTASGDLFLYLRFYWVWMDVFASLGIASRAHWW